jgi:glycerate 2-kinase
MNILIVPDSFKDCLPAMEVASSLADGIRESHPGAVIRLFPIADGGEGTASCLHHHLGGEWVDLQVGDPLNRIIQASYLMLDQGKTAVIEMAAASGLELLSKADRDPLRTSTLGTGEMIRHAMKQGAGRIILTIGGSATVDAGTGLAKALGFRFIDNNGMEIQPNGGSLTRISRIDASHVLAELKQTEIIIACDVQNILNGPHGAAIVYGPQKGASPEAVKTLQRGLENTSRIVLRETGFDADAHPGSGAAGGTALFLMAYGNTRLVKGFDLLASMTKLHEAINTHEVVITGEGRIDSQTDYGKVVASVAEMVRKTNGKRLIGVAGRIEGHAGDIKKQYGMERLFAIRNFAKNDEDSIRNAAAYLKIIGKQVLLIWHLLIVLPEDTPSYLYSCLMML